MTEPNAPTRDAITADLLDDVLATAGRAPSLHNSQPWRFRFLQQHQELELLIDPERALPISDPQARELVISCGAALYNLRLALRCHALVPHVDVAPASGDPLLLARITVEAGPAPTREELRQLAAVVHRHTHRHGFVATTIPEVLAAALAADVAAEGAELVWIDEPGRVAAVCELARLADGLQVNDPAWQAEVEGWVDTTRTGRRDGVPLAAVPATAAGNDLGLPARTFVQDRAGDPRRGAAGRVAVIVTPGDELTDWLATGQGLQRMLLRAADHWLFATYATAPLEVPALRAVLRERLALRDAPQMVLELGYAGCAHVTPRLPADRQREG